MEWYILLLVIFGSLIVLMVSGMPVAFAFLLILVAAFWLWAGTAGLVQLTYSLRTSVSTFTLVPIPLFVLMGEVMFQSGMALKTIDALDKWFGRFPGRLSLLAVANGTLLATLTGVSMASVAILGSALVPEMEKRGYQKPMSLGPILGSGGLAIMIPPSAAAVALGALGMISIGKLLIAIIVPGLLMAAFYSAYIVGRCFWQPSLAPSYKSPPVPLREKIMHTVYYVLPLGGIVFLVTGVILLGIATPSEAAATGTIGVVLLAAAYGRLNWTVIKKATIETTHVSVMVLMIIVGAKGFSQVLAWSGSTRGMLSFVEGLAVGPIQTCIAMMVIVMILGMFINLIPLVMITVPLFMPIVHSLGLNEIWFAATMMVAMEMGTVTPPFGMVLFAMKGVAPSGTTMADIYKAGLPFLVCDFVVLSLVIAFPPIALWLPGLMR